MRLKQSSFSEKKEFVDSQIEKIGENRIPIKIISDGIQQIANIGMIFRIADALRIEEILFYNYLETFDEKTLLKKSRSCSKYVTFSYLDSIEKIIELKNTYELVLLEKTNISIAYKKYMPNKPMCLVLGSEKFGISKELMEFADTSVHLPMTGINTSINVATAASVALYDFYDKMKSSEND
jgi:tRNA G18 (ribose-2'-O)-methylase SpoU